VASFVDGDDILHVLVEGLEGDLGASAGVAAVHDFLELFVGDLLAEVEADLGQVVLGDVAWVRAAYRGPRCRSR
jgi:hypothetical protein